MYFLYDGTQLVAEYSDTDGTLLQHFAYSAKGLSQRRGNQHRLFTFDPDGNLVNRLTALSDVLSITWHNQLGIVYQDQLASTGGRVEPPQAGTVGYQGYFGIYSDPNTRTFDPNGRFAALVTLNEGEYFDPIVAQGMQRRVGEVNPYARQYRSDATLAGRLVVAFADAGWTAGDPSAPEGLASLKMTAAVARLVAAGFEIQGYISLALGIGKLAAGTIGAVSRLAGGAAATSQAQGRTR